MKNSSFKRILSVCLALILMLALCACGSTAAPSQSTDTPATNDTPANADASKDQIVIRYSHSNGTSEDDMNQQCALKFAELVDEYTGGAIRVDIYPAAQLGDEVECFGACGLDSQEVAAGAITNYVSYSPTMTVLTLPYIFENIDIARGFFHDEMDYLAEITVKQANSRVLAIACPAARELTTVKEVHTLADMKGMKVRVPSTQPMIDCYTAWGASPQIVAWGETYTALEQGVAEAQDNPIWVLIDNRLAEVQNYVVNTSYIMQPNAIVMSEDFYQRLTPEQQDAVTRAAREACVYFEQLGDEAYAKYQKLAEDEGVEFLGAPDDIDQWIELARGIWSNSYDTIGAGDTAYAEEIVNYIQNYGENFGK